MVDQPRENEDEQEPQQQDTATPESGNAPAPTTEDSAASSMNPALEQYMDEVSDKY